MGRGRLSPTIDDLTPPELEFCRRLACGDTQRQAYIASFKPKRAKPATIDAKASKLAATTRVRDKVRELLRATEKSAILSVQEYLRHCIAREKEAQSAGNLTAAASYARLVGQTIQALSDRLTVDDAREADAAVVERVRQVNPEAAELLRRTLASADDFTGGLEPGEPKDSDPKSGSVVPLKPTGSDK